MTASPREGQWQARPWLAAVVRLLILGIPVLAGWFAARWLTPAVADWHSSWARVLTVLVTALMVSVLVSRATSRFLPLAVLLRMTMLFPDKAPSRMKIARRTTSLTDIKSRLSSPRLDEQDAAATMLALVTALGRHDRHTRGHSERVRLFCDLLARELKLSPAESGRLRWAALVHDIGKLEVPAAVLNKAGTLDAREWDLIRSHPDAGAQLAGPLKNWLGPWFAGIPEHHERYDGTGYPLGLAATAISTAGRAIAVVDAFETMTAARSYKSARSTLNARAELTKCAGSHFDPVMVRAFLAISLPRLLWSVGPLAFAVNLPYLKALGEGGARLGNAVGTTTVAASNVAGVTAVAMAISTAPSAGMVTADARQPPVAHAVTVHRNVGGDTGAPRPITHKPTAQIKPKPAKIAATHQRTASKPTKHVTAPKASHPSSAKKPAKAAKPKPPKAHRPLTAAELRAAWIAWWLAHRPKQQNGHGGNDNHGDHGANNG